MMIIAFFIFLYTLALYLSSMSTLAGLQELNSANILLNLNSQIVESVSTSERDLDNINSISDIKEMKFSYIENQKVTDELINQSVIEAQKRPKLLEMLNETKDLLHQLDLHYKVIFTKLNSFSIEKSRYKNATDILSDILVAKQLIMDTKETLRKIQINVKNRNDKDFSAIFKNRFKPIIVAVGLSVVFFTFVITFGFSITKKIGNSISNLLHATDLVAQGDLSLKVKILDHDEIGRLTDAFNKMILSLKVGQDNLSDAIDARDEFLSIASHELKTPLTPLKLQVQKLIRNIEGGTHGSIPIEKLKFIAESSDRQISRLSKLIDNLLDVSRINTGKFTLEKSQFNLNEMIEEVLRQFAQQFRDSNSEIDYVSEENTVGIWDKVRVEQVFINLLTNAVKYAPHKPIHVKVTNDGHCAKIVVSDEGPGISTDDREKIFNRFERGVSPENIGGLGLGLYISKQIIEAHHGKIFLDSTTVNGSVFIVELPLV